MQDLTPQSPLLQRLSDGINNKIYEFGDMLEEKTKQVLGKIDEKMDELTDKIKSMFGGLLGKAKDKVTPPIRKPSTPAIARSKQPAKAIAQTPQITPEVQKQVNSLNIPTIAAGISEAHTCHAPNAPRISAGISGFGMGY